MLSILFAAAAAASVVPSEAAIRNVCEPLIAGTSARWLETVLVGSGFKKEVLAGQPVLRQGELIIGLSDVPKVCFVQAPTSMTREQGFALADRWAQRHPGAFRSPVTKGSDGAPVRGWSAPIRSLALIASQQTAPSGKKIMVFIVMPTRKTVVR